MDPIFEPLLFPLSTFIDVADTQEPSTFGATKEVQVEQELVNYEELNQGMKK